jgi:hypothetical protein
MSNSIRRLKGACTRVGVGKTDFNDRFRLNDDADPYVPNTDNTVRRVRAVPLGERSIGFFDDELDRLLEELRRWRDRQPTALPSARPLLRAPARHRPPPHSARATARRVRS